MNEETWNTLFLILSHFLSLTLQKNEYNKSHYISSDNCLLNYSLQSLHLKPMGFIGVAPTLTTNPIMAPSMTNANERRCTMNFCHVLEPNEVLETPTPSLQVKCTTNCANSAYGYDAGSCRAAGRMNTCTRSCRWFALSSKSSCFLQISYAIRKTSETSTYGGGCEIRTRVLQVMSLSRYHSSNPRQVRYL